ncbi:MAG: PIN domain-containing protein [Candidatus Diapherotrites archaeon]
MEKRSDLEEVKKAVTGKDDTVKVALDTNMLTAAEQFGFDVFAECRAMFGSRVRFFIPKAVLIEMEHIGKKNGKMRKATAVAEKIIEVNKERGDVEVIDCRGKTADRGLIELAGRGFVVATNDKELRRKVKEKDGKVLLIRKKSILELE